jgi:DNA polymerase-3 subunit beta
MKVKVLQENLNKALSNTSRFASSRAQLPVLGNILLKAFKNKLLIAATNLEISLSTQIGAQVEKDGEITVPARVIAETIGNLLPESLSLVAEKEQLKVEAQGTTMVISGMNSSDFPAIPQKIADKGAIRLPKEAFLKALNQVLFASSLDETRPVLTGILFLFKKGWLTLVATDGFRLSQNRFSLPGYSGEARVILPKSVLIEASRLGGDEEEILLSYKSADNQVSFAFADSVLSSRVLEGEFPDFEKILPKESTLTAEVDREDFLRAVKLASVFARDSANIVKLEMKKNSLKVSAESSQSGRQESNVEAKTAGEGLEIAFNYKFLEEFLHSTSGGTVKMSFSGANAPAVLTDPNDKDYLHLVMPVRIQA